MISADADNCLGGDCKAFGASSMRQSKASTVLSMLQSTAKMHYAEYVRSPANSSLVAKACQPWTLLPGKYLSGYSSAGNACFSKADAKSLCLSTQDCNGITKQHDECGGSKWTLRNGVAGSTASGYDASNLESEKLDRSCQPTPSPTPAYNCEVGEGESGQAVSSSFENSESSCATQCNADANCAGFDYTTVSKGTACRTYGANTPRLGNGGVDNRQYCVKPPTPSPILDPTPSPTTTTTTTTISLEGLDDDEQKIEVNDEQVDLHECRGWCYSKKHNDKPWTGTGGKCNWYACSTCPKCAAA